MGKAVPEYVDVDDGRDILVCVEVELLAEWGITQRSKRWRRDVVIP